MSRKPNTRLSDLPSVDRLLKSEALSQALIEFGHKETTRAIRAALALTRMQISAANSEAPDKDFIVKQTIQELVHQSIPSLQAVFNLTGTILHTNLGRASLPEEAIKAITDTARGASNLEYRLDEGKRGDRDEHIEKDLCAITGAEAATIVNNNAAAVMLVLNTFALNKEVPTSRGELIEIGGSFRMPDIMKQSGCKLIEVGTTNRTHLKDYSNAIGSDTGIIMKIHTSNYVVEGYTAEVSETELAKLCHDNKIPFAVDLGSGTLTDLTRFNLPQEPTPMDAMKNGADLVTFSGDKLLGGPQSGIIVGTKKCISELKKNPMKRALRCDKLTLSALSAVLKLYRDPDRVAERIPTLRALVRPVEDIQKIANQIMPELKRKVGTFGTVTGMDCESQVGSGALPTRTINSAGLVIKPTVSSGTRLNELAAAFRKLPIPVIGRIQDDKFLLDLRCLEDVVGFNAQLPNLKLPK